MIFIRILQKYAVIANFFVILQLKQINSRKKYETVIRSALVGAHF